MPAKPVWYSKINEVARELQASPRPFVDRATVEFLLGVGRRRAQQIMVPCITDRIGANGLADRDKLIVHLRRLADSGDGYYERRRRCKVAEILSQPRLLVAAPAEVVNREIKNLPEGIRLDRGRITVEFDDPRQALEKLLALAMAIGNDFDGFARSTCPSTRRD